MVGLCVVVCHSAIGVVRDAGGGGVDGINVGADHLLYTQMQRRHGRDVGWYFGLGTLPMGCGPPGSQPLPVVLLPIAIMPLAWSKSHKSAPNCSRRHVGYVWLYSRFRNLYGVFPSTLLVGNWYGQAWIGRTAALYSSSSNVSAFFCASVSIRSNSSWVLFMHGGVGGLCDNRRALGSFWCRTGSGLGLASLHCSDPHCPVYWQGLGR